MASPSEYTVVRLVLDRSEEFANVGVIVLGGGRVYARWLEDLRRVRAFVGPVSPAIAELRASIEAGELSVNDIRKMTLDWNGRVQFTPLRASLSTPAALIGYVADRFLCADPVITGDTEITALRAVVAALPRCEALTQRRTPPCSSIGTHLVDGQWYACALHVPKGVTPLPYAAALRALEDHDAAAAITGEP
jgi:hypothetical protein